MAFKRLGVMLDMSRNAVMHVPALKNFIVTLSDMGYNTLLLYTEDTYEIPGEPYFGHFRGRYSQEELRQIVDFASGYGMEVIPCIQTLAHLNAIFRWSVYQPIQDCNDILLSEEDKTYELIGKMLDSVKACYRSKYVHIGMDEAHMVGLGKYLDKNGFQNRFEIFSRHLKRVSEMVAQRGLKPIIWGDMFFRLKNHGVYNCYDPIVPTQEEVNIPPEVTITHWDYYSDDQARYEIMLRAHKQLGNPVWYAGGIWTWKGFAPDNEFSIRSTLSAIHACQAEGVENIFFTMWGDNGGECSRHSVLPALFATACFAQGTEDMETIKAAFAEKYQIPFDAFLLLDMHPSRQHLPYTQAVINPEKYLLFNDPFLGVCDSTLDGSEANNYKNLATELAQYANHPAFGVCFRSQSLLSAVLARKADLGVRTRTVYQTGNKNDADALLTDYDLCIRDLEQFLAAFRHTWFWENKPHGFDVQDIRIGGLIQRMKSCRDRLAAWKTDDVPIAELEETSLDLMGGGQEFSYTPLRYPFWHKAASVNIL